jgi:hypothetical protein
MPFHLLLIFSIILKIQYLWHLITYSKKTRPKESKKPLLIFAYYILLETREFHIALR